jgi:hypothetical protein
MANRTFLLALILACGIAASVTAVAGSVHGYLNGNEFTLCVRGPSVPTNAPHIFLGWQTPRGRLAAVVVTEYLQRNSRDRHFAASALIADAMQNTSPCSAATPAR